MGAAQAVASEGASKIAHPNTRLWVRSLAAALVWRSLLRLTFEFGKKRSRSSQVVRFKPFGKPVMDFCQQSTRLGPLALVVPQSSEADRRAQFKQFRLLTASYFNRRLETVLGLVVLIYLIGSKQLSP